jgi:hypothetical protein
MAEPLLVSKQKKAARFGMTVGDSCELCTRKRTVMIMLGGQQGWFGEAPVGLATPPDSLNSSRFRFHSLPGMTAVEAQSVGISEMFRLQCASVTVKGVNCVEADGAACCLQRRCKDAAALACPRHESCWQWRQRMKRSPI